jgi:hypothetical protein
MSLLLPDAGHLMAPRENEQSFSLAVPSKIFQGVQLDRFCSHSFAGACCFALGRRRGQRDVGCRRSALQSIDIDILSPLPCDYVFCPRRLPASSKAIVLPRRSTLDSPTVPSPPLEIYQTRPAAVSLQAHNPQIPLTPAHNVSLDTQRPERRAVQERLPEVRRLFCPFHIVSTTNHPATATTLRMALLSATSMPAAQSPRRCRRRSVPMAATRSSSTTCRR